MKVEVGSALVLREVEQVRCEFDEYKLLGGQVEWACGVPQMFQYLQNPMLTVAVPWSTDRPLDHFAACTYWTPLLYLLLYSFGWRCPGRGLREWRRRDSPLDDPRFGLIQHIWGERSDLRLLSLEACLYDIGQPLERFLTGGAVESGARPVTDLEDEISRVQSEISPDSPFNAEGQRFHSLQALHFNNGGHLETPIKNVVENQVDDSKLIASDRRSRRATLVADGLVGWYSDLVTHGQNLPDVGNRSWHVDVFVKTVGFLGTYRRSRQTGLWFSGAHRFHEWGNLGNE